MAQTWERPADIPVPQVWARFEGPRPMPDGRVPSFWIQDVRKEDEDVVLDNMKNNFLRQEVMAAHLRLADDPETVEECVVLWKDAMSQQLSLALWTDYPDGKPHFVGCNLLIVASRGDPILEVNALAMKKAVGFMYYMEHVSNIHERYGVDKYLSGLGLSIIEEFRGMGLGVELLKARVPLGQALGFELTATLFTGIASQKQADRAGFHQVVEVPFTDYKYDDEVVLDITDPPTAHEKAMKIPLKK